MICFLLHCHFSVRIYSVNSGRSLEYFGVKGKGTGQLNKPVDVSWDKEGHLLVLDEGRVQVFTKKGEFVRALAVKSKVHALSVIGQSLFISDVYSVTKYVWKIK